jgi:hypothetical protein
VLTAPSNEWPLDFLNDALASGRSVRGLSVVDDFTRECLTLKSVAALQARQQRLLDKLISKRVAPKVVAHGHGAELTSRAFPGPVCQTEDCDELHPARQAHAERGTLQTSSVGFAMNI